MLPLFDTTAHSIIRQMRMKTQNMMVLTLEFTRILFSGGEKPFKKTPNAAYIIH